MNPGDRVRLVNRTGLAAREGATATVVEIGTRFMKIKWDDNGLRNATLDGWCHIDAFEPF